MACSIYPKKVTNPKVLVLTTTFPRWKDDSTLSIVYDISKKINEERIELTVLAPHAPSSKQFERMRGLKVYRFPYFWPVKYERLCYGGGIVPNMSESTLAKIQVPFLILSETFHALKLARREKVDLIHSYWIIPSGLVGMICKKILGKPLLITCQEGNICFLENNFFLRYIAIHVLKNADYITTVSTGLRDQLIKWSIPAEKIFVAQNAINLEDYGIKIRKRLGYNLLYVGRLVSEKGVVHLLEAFGKIKNEFPQMSLKIAGDGPLRSKLEKKVRGLSLNDDVTFLGPVPHSKVIEYMQEADVFILPSHNEGLPLVVLEAMACGTPVIVSSFHGATDIISNGINGLLFNPRDSEDLAKKISLLFSNRNLSERISVNGLATVKEKFNDDVVSRVIRNIYFDIIKPQKRLQ